MTVLTATSQTDCIFCGSSTKPYLKDVFDCRFGIDQSFDISSCPHCRIEQTIPLPTASELKDFYTDYYNFGGETGTTYTALRQRFLNSGLYKIWLWVDGDISFHAMQGTGRLLDVGCNEGRGLSIYQRNGYQAEGLELNETAARVARSHGFKVYTEPLEEFHPAELFDVVVISNVLEHSLRPQEMLADIHRILKPGGEVWISCPNNASWLRALCGRFWINWHVPFHIVHFSRLALADLLKTTGFKLKAARQETPALWVAQSLIARVFSKQGKPTRQLRNPFFVGGLIFTMRLFLFPVLWFGNLLGCGDCLIMTARKV